VNIESLISIINQFPKATQEQIEIAARQLKMLHYDFETGPYQIDLLYANHQTVIDYLYKLGDMSFARFYETRFLEPEYKEDSEVSKEEYLLNEKKRRASYVISKYHLLCMLRQDNEQAWDEVNELYFDD
jgi:hypothetical protein